MSSDRESARVPAWRVRADRERRDKALARLRVDDPIRDQLAGARDHEHGWNRGWAGIMEEVHERRYGQLADAALRTLADAGRLVPPGRADRRLRRSQLIAKYLRWRRR